MKTITVRNEIWFGSRLKLEYDEYTKEMRLDRIVNQEYPANYGYVPNTMAPDGDPIDVFILGEPLPPGILLEVVPVAAVQYLDQGVADPKVVAVVRGAAMPSDEELGLDLENIKGFLRTYKAGGEVLGEVDPWSILKVVGHE